MFIDNIAAAKLMDEIVKLAIKDYADLIEKNNKGQKISAHQYEDLRDFFRSEWFNDLAEDYDGEVLLEYMDRKSTRPVELSRASLPWDEMEVEALVNLRNKGYTWQDVGEALGRHRELCRLKYANLKKAGVV